MKGEKHEVCALENGTVELYNIEDSHYACYFETRAEINKFIKQMQKARDKAFGKGPKIVFDFDKMCREFDRLSPNVRPTNYELVKE